MRTQGQPLLQSGQIPLLYRILYVQPTVAFLSSKQSRQNISYRHHLFCQCSTHTLLLTLKTHCTCYDSFKPSRIFVKSTFYIKFFLNWKGFALNFGCKSSLVLLSASFYYKFFLFVILSFVFFSDFSSSGFPGLDFKVLRIFEYQFLSEKLQNEIILRVCEELELRVNDTRDFLLFKGRLLQISCIWGLDLILMIVIPKIKKKPVLTPQKICNK